MAVLCFLTDQLKCQGGREVEQQFTVFVAFFLPVVNASAASRRAFTLATLHFVPQLEKFGLLAIGRQGLVVDGEGKVVFGTVDHDDLESLAGLFVALLNFISFDTGIQGVGRPVCIQRRGCSVHDFAEVRGVTRIAPNPEVTGE